MSWKNIHHTFGGISKMFFFFSLSHDSDSSGLCQLRGLPSQMVLSVRLFRVAVSSRAWMFPTRANIRYLSLKRHNRGCSSWLTWNTCVIYSGCGTNYVPSRFATYVTFLRVFVTLRPNGILARGVECQCRYLALCVNCRSLTDMSKDGGSPRLKIQGCEHNM